MGVLIISCIPSYLNSYLGQLKIWWETTPTRFLRNCKRWVEVHLAQVMYVHVWRKNDRENTFLRHLCSNFLKTNFTIHLKRCKCFELRSAIANHSNKTVICRTYFGNNKYISQGWYGNNIFIVFSFPILPTHIFNDIQKMPIQPWSLIHNISFYA